MLSDESVLIFHESESNALLNITIFVIDYLIYCLFLKIKASEVVF